MAEKLQPKKKSVKKTPLKVGALKVTFEKKRECEAKALEVVSLLLDSTSTAEDLLVKCLYINELYYEDVVEERALADLCGYPTCSNPLEKRKSSQLYHISSHFNKVFDITKRKRFCSNLCFKASEYLKNQLPSCPVWLLDQEQSGDLKLYQHQEKILGIGNEVPLEEPTMKNELLRSKIEFENSADELSKSMNKLTTKASAADAEQLQGTASRLVPKPHKSIPRAKEILIKQPDLSRLEVIEQSLKQWMTLDSLKYLLGLERYQKALASSGHNVDDLNNCVELKELLDKEDVAQKYSELCRKLDVETIADHALDSKLVRDARVEVAKKGLPSYEHLAKDAQFSLNVQAFYQGRMELLTEDADVKNNVAAPKKTTTVEKPEENSDQHFCLPLTDNHNQRALRRRMVLDKLNRLNDDVVLEMLKIRYSDISAQARQLVGTFNLQANNITFKPAEWKLVNLIIIHLLAIKMNTIQQKLLQESAQQCVSTILRMINKPADYFTHLVEVLMDVNELIKS